MVRRLAGMLCLGLLACTPQPSGPISGTVLRPDMNISNTPRSGVVIVEDVSRTQLGGTVIYDEVIPFTIGSFTPADPVTNTPEMGNQISGAVQSRVVRSSATGTLVFSFRFRDLEFRPPGPGQAGGANFIELVQLSGFGPFMPVEAFFLSPNQSLGAAPLLVLGTVRPNGTLEFNTSLDATGGSTFFSILTTATRFKTGRFLSFSNAGFAGTTLDKIAVPAP